MRIRGHFLEQVKRKRDEGCGPGGDGRERGRLEIRLSPDLPVPGCRSGRYTCYIYIFFSEYFDFSTFTIHTLSFFYFVYLACFFFFTIEKDFDSNISIVLCMFRDTKQNKSNCFHKFYP